MLIALAAVVLDVIGCAGPARGAGQIVQVEYPPSTLLSCGVAAGQSELVHMLLPDGQGAEY